MQFARTLRIFVTALTLAVGAPLFAQTPQVAPTPATPLDKLTAAQIAAGREIVMLSGISRTFNAFVPTAAQRIFDAVTPTRPELRTELTEVLKAMVPEYEKRTAEMVELTGKLFASVMTEGDLKTTAAFFKSPAGQKYVEMQPRVIDQMVIALDEWNRKIADEMLQRARAEMKKKGKDM